MTSPVFKKFSPKFSLQKGEKNLFLTEELIDSAIKIPENSELTLVALLKKGWKGTKKLDFHFEGPDSKVIFLAFIIGKKNQTFYFQTNSIHETYNTKAYYYVKAALFDNAQVNYKGSLIIKKKAKKTDCYLAHHTLMFSEKAHNESIPCLEIEADDVKAGHAASIGQVDADQIFYLQSRGIDRKTAEHILTKSFFEKELLKIKEKSVREFLSAQLEKSL